MTTLITGATGFVGSRVVSLLAETGEPVRVFGRSSEKLGRLLDLPNVEGFHGDLLDPEALSEAVRGARRIYHLAAHVTEWTTDPTLFEQINVMAWENLLKAAATGAVERIVYTSSFMALGSSDDGPIGDESLVHPPDHLHNAYEKTKYLGYLIARKYVEKGLPIVTVFPGVVFGPGPLTEGNFLVRLIGQLARGEVKALPGKGEKLWCYAFVEDVARGHLLAMEKGMVGEGYILGGDNLTLNAFVDKVCDAMQVKRPRRKIPLALMGLIARFMEAKSRFSGRPPAMTAGRVGVFKHHWAYTSDKAVRSLGYAITPFAKALPATLEWMRSETLL